MGVATVSANTVHGALSALRRRGERIDTFLADVGLTGSAVELPDAQIPRRVASHLWDEAARAVGDLAFGVKATESLDAGTFGLISYLGVTSPTVGEALRLMCKYWHVQSNVGVWKVAQCGDELRVNHAPRNCSVHFREYCTASIPHYLRRLVGDEWQLSEVFFAHKRAGPTESHEAVFGLKPRFDQGQSGFSFPTRLLGAPLVTADPHLNRLLQRHATWLLSRLQQPASARGQLKELLLSARANHNISLLQAARGLGVAPRSLQRQLKNEGTSYREVVDQVRLELATQLLIEARCTANETATELGFSEPAAFHRAFKRFSGMSPGAYQRRHSRIGSHVALSGLRVTQGRPSPPSAAFVRR